MNLTWLSRRPGIIKVRVSKPHDSSESHAVLGALVRGVDGSMETSKVTEEVEGIEVRLAQGGGEGGGGEQEEHEEQERGERGGSEEGEDEENLPQPKADKARAARVVGEGSTASSEGPSENRVGRQGQAVLLCRCLDAQGARDLLEKTRDTICGLPQQELQL